MNNPSVKAAACVVWSRGVGGADAGKTQSGVALVGKTQQENVASVVLGVPTWVAFRDDYVNE